jgi:hypothetical protein
MTRGTTTMREEEEEEEEGMKEPREVDDESPKDLCLVLDKEKERSV